MKISYIFYLSLASLKTRKLRSGLTVSGIMIGIALVLFLVSLGFGLQQIATESIASAEALMNVEVTRGEATLLEMDDDARQTFLNLENVISVSYRADISSKLTLDNSSVELALYAVSDDYLKDEGLKVDQGELLSETESAQPLIVSDQLALALGFSNTQEALDKIVEITALLPVQTELGNQVRAVKKEFTIVGIVAEQDGVILGYTPFSQFIELGSEYDLIRVKVANEDQVQNVKQQIRGLGYQAETAQDTVAEINRIFLVIELVIAVIGAISIVVASLGALNTLTVSLLERTREIGLLKALGARRGSVYFMFLVESLVIGIIGGVLGIFFGWGVGGIINLILGFLAQRNGEITSSLFATPYWFVIFIFGLVVVTSLLTGLYPAWRASKINVLDALRRE